jgi:hypothetical protein
VPLPDTVAVPTVVPPLVQIVGALAWGPKTVNVIVPVAPLVAPLSAAVIEPVPMAVPGVSVAGAPAVSGAVALPTTVDAIPEPQVVVLAELLESPE